MVIPLIVTAAENPAYLENKNRVSMERWIWFLGMAVFLVSAVSMVLNQVKKPDYKKNYVFVRHCRVQRLCLCFWQAVVSRDILDFWLMLPALSAAFGKEM